MELIRLKSFTVMNVTKTFFRNLMKLKVISAFSCLSLLVSCSQANDKILMELKNQCEAQQKQIAKLEKSNDWSSDRISQLETICLKLQNRAANSSVANTQSMDMRLQNIEARIDRDENVINRIGHRASDAYSQSVNGLHIPGH